MTALCIKYPRLVVFTISEVCDQTCLFCSGSAKKESIFADVHTFESLHWLKHVHNITLVGSGEALTNPDYPEIIECLHKLAPRAERVLYTNGLGLNGKKLGYTAMHASHVFISQNSLVESTYNSIIRNGDFARSVKNLETLAKRRPDTLYVKLMLVALKQNINELKTFIDAAAEWKFQQVHVMRGYFPGHNALPKDSYLDELPNHADIDALREYARKKNVLFTTNEAMRGSLLGPCYNPWGELRLWLKKDGWHADVCCRGSLNMVVQNESLPNLDAYWNHARVQFIRKTVNDMDAALANRMCMSCRTRISGEVKYHEILNTTTYFKKKYGDSYFEPVIL